MSREEAKAIIEKLIERYREHKEEYHLPDYNEQKTRQDFINPFFKALGWDIDNEKGDSEAYREVIYEDKIVVRGKCKAPDYGFRLSGSGKKRLFYVEAKKPSVALKVNKEAAYQLRRYGSSAQAFISILTNFEDFIIYDCSRVPNLNDSATVARLKYIHFEDYIKEFDFIYDTFSHEAVTKGRFDKFVQGSASKKGTDTLDKRFVQSLDEWRNYLAKSIALNNKTIDDEELNFAVQQTIDRLIFLRFCEDRAIEPYAQLQKAVSKGDAYKNLFELFKQADDKYNSGLFDFEKDVITPKLKVDNKVLKIIIDELYYPKCNYEFSVMPVEILGNAYEQFLGKVIRITPARGVKIEEKPEVRKAGGVYYTPQYIVEYIVKNTVGKLIEGKAPKEIEKIKIVDPACGSGSFLLGAFEYILNYHINWYHKELGIRNYELGIRNKKNNPLTPQGTLTTNEKRRILLNNIFGVDIDANAVEVTKLSLLLKCMEGETEASVKQQLTMFHQRVLPDLDNNIKDGNSLIDTDIYDSEIDLGFEKKIKPFNWKNGFPDVFKQGGFDVVIGNPPYGASYGNEIKYHLSTKYNLPIPIADTFLMFLKRAFQISKHEALVSYIIPSTWLYMSQYLNFREQLLIQFQIDEIQLFRKSVFDSVTVETCTILSTNKKADISSKYHFKEIKAEPNQFIYEENTIEQERLVKDSEINLILSNDTINSLFIKIKNNKLQLKEVALVVCGLTPYRLGKGNPKQNAKIVKERGFDADYKKDKTYRQYLMGRDFSQYNWQIEKERWISYGDWLAEPRYKAPFNDPKKIVIRQTSDRLIAHLDTHKFLSLKNVHNIRVTACGFTYEYLLGIINSKLLDWWYQKFIPEKGRVFAEVKVVNLEKLPIKSIDFKNKSEKSFHDEIVKHVDLLLKLNEELKIEKLSNKIEQIKQRSAYSEEKINELVYELYGLTEEEIKIVENTNG